MFNFRKKNNITADGMVFSFDDAVSSMDRKEIIDMFNAYWQGKYYEPPVSLCGLAKSVRSCTWHESALEVKANILASTFIPHAKLSLAEFEGLATNMLIFGNAYLQANTNRLGRAVRYQSLLSRWVRVGRNDDFYYLNAGKAEKIENEVYHLKLYDINQNIYGMPNYLSALSSAWLSESATLFRRKYYINGSHAGYILHITDNLDNKSKENLEEQLKQSKGLGNFKNLLLHAPNGKKDGVNLIPIAEVTAKDEFFNIKTLTRDDILAAHRVPPQLMSVVPQGTAGFGDIEKQSKVFVINELTPMQARLQSLNEMVGEEIIRFKPYALESTEVQ